MTCLTAIREQPQLVTRYKHAKVVSDNVQVGSLYYVVQSSSKGFPFLSMAYVSEEDANESINSIDCN